MKKHAALLAVMGLGTAVVMLWDHPFLRRALDLFEAPARIGPAPYDARTILSPDEALRRWEQRYR